MWQIELCVQLKTYDLSALTAKQTLWEMGYKKLTNIFRQDYYLFNIPKETKEEAESIVKSLAEKTPLFVNPNKHTYYIRNSKLKIQNSKFEEVLVWYREDVRRKMLLDSLKSFGYSVEDILCGVLWQIEIGDRNICQEIVERLLVNPHSQGYRIL
ncbi:MAG: phosphoribosylformylglycinamidine synthase subunit PurS [bacterium]|nr:phosphoribosylformylglycinamidine synthase subunit PurS [bacterium]